MYNHFIVRLVTGPMVLLRHLFGAFLLGLKGIAMVVILILYTGCQKENNKGRQKNSIIVGARANLIPSPWVITNKAPQSIPEPNEDPKRNNESHSMLEVDEDSFESHWIKDEESLPDIESILDEQENNLKSLQEENRTVKEQLIKAEEGIRKAIPNVIVNLEHNYMDIMQTYKDCLVEETKLFNENNSNKEQLRRKAKGFVHRMREYVKQEILPDPNKRDLKVIEWRHKLIHAIEEILQKTIRIAKKSTIQLHRLYKSIKYPQGNVDKFFRFVYILHTLCNGYDALSRLSIILKYEGPKRCFEFDQTMHALAVESERAIKELEKAIKLNDYPLSIQELIISETTEAKTMSEITIHLASHVALTIELSFQAMNKFNKIEVDNDKKLERFKYEKHKLTLYASILNMIDAYVTNKAPNKFIDEKAKQEILKDVRRGNKYLTKSKQFIK